MARPARLVPLVRWGQLVLPVSWGRWVRQAHQVRRVNAALQATMAHKACKACKVHKVYKGRKVPKAPKVRLGLALLTATKAMSFVAKTRSRWPLG